MKKKFAAILTNMVNDYNEYSKLLAMMESAQETGSAKHYRAKVVALRKYIDEMNEVLDLFDLKTFTYLEYNYPVYVEKQM